MPQFLPLPSNGSAKHFTWKCGKMWTMIGSRWVFRYSSYYSQPALLPRMDSAPASPATGLLWPRDSQIVLSWLTEPSPGHCSNLAFSGGLSPDAGQKIATPSPNRYPASLLFLLSPHHNLTHHVQHSSFSHHWNTSSKRTRSLFCSLLDLQCLSVCTSQLWI